MHSNIAQRTWLNKCSFSWLYIRCATGKIRKLHRTKAAIWPLSSLWWCILSRRGWITFCLLIECDQRHEEIKIHAICSIINIRNHSDETADFIATRVHIDFFVVRFFSVFSDRGSCFFCRFGRVVHCLLIAIAFALLGRNIFSSFHWWHASNKYYLNKHSHVKNVIRHFGQCA